VPEGPRRHPIARLMLRLVGAALLIALLATVASATTFFEDVGIISDAIGGGVLIKSKALAPTYAGQPVTILILGSDSRAESHIVYDRSDPQHSDTIILMRMNPNSGQTTLMSVPRDLQVSFTANGGEYTDQKITTAYTYGGATTTLRVVENLLHIKVNDIIVIDFQAFAFLTNGLGCVYIDVDHLYDSGAYADYAHIYIPPGYRPLCYYQALSYVRYREGDSTYARDAREQDFIRQAKQQLGIRTSLLTNPNNLNKLLRSAGHGISTNIRGEEATLRLIEIAESSIDHPVHQIQFPDDGSVYTPSGGSEQVDPPPAQIAATVHEFLYGTSSASLPSTSQATNAGHAHHHRHREHSTLSPTSLGLVATPSYAMQDAREMSVSVPFPVEIPRYTSPAGTQNDTDDFYAFKEVVPLLATFGGLHYSGYRITWEDSAAPAGAYYGIDGLNWTDPPLFHNAPTRRIDGRTYEFVENGTHYQDIGWIAGKDIYWVSNTLFDNLSNDTMLALAESAAPL
jgi:LCP family protein required for cell wall assembly